MFINPSVRGGAIVHGSLNADGSGGIVVHSRLGLWVGVRVGLGLLVGVAITAFNLYDFFSPFPKSFGPYI